MFGEIAIALVMCLFLEINALVFAVMIVAFLAHEVTAWRGRRDQAPTRR
jgi:hypothetical protein